MVTYYYQPLVRQSLACRDLVDEAKKFHLRPDLRMQMQSQRTRPRTGEQDQCQLDKVVTLVLIYVAL